MNKHCHFVRISYTIIENILSTLWVTEIVMDNSPEELGLEEGKRQTKTSFKAMEPIKMEQ